MLRCLQRLTQGLNRQNLENLGWNFDGRQKNVYLELPRTAIERAQYSIPVPSLEVQREILDGIRHEQELIVPSRQLINIFTAKIESRIRELWEAGR